MFIGQLQFQRLRECQQYLPISKQTYFEVYTRSMILTIPEIQRKLDVQGEEERKTVNKKLLLLMKMYIVKDMT